jgi:hypothetical protein
VTQIVRMPNGDRVGFPDDMSRDEIHFFIMKKFPEAPGHQGMIGQFVRGVGQGITGTLLDISSVIPDVPFLGGNLPGLPDPAKKAREESKKAAEKFANEPSEGAAQSFGKFGGGAIPYALAGGTGLTGLAMKKGFEASAGALPLAIHAATHALGHKIGLPSSLRKIVADFISSHPAVAAAGQAVKPTMGAIGGGIGRSIESRGPAIAGGIRETLREPELEPIKPSKPKPTGSYKGDRERTRDGQQP